MNIAKRILGLILILFGLYVTVAVAGKSTIIACERVESVEVDCTTQSAPLGIPWDGKKTLHGVQRAATTEYGGLGHTFVLELETREGTVTLNGDMTVNEKETAERINAFLQDPREDSLLVNYVDWGRLVLALFFVGGFMGIYPGLYLLFAGFWRDLAHRVQWGLVAGIACLLFGLFCLYVFGRISTLTCTHVEPTQVDCRHTESWAGWIPLGSERTIYDVKSADADRRRLSSRGHSFYVRLRTEEGVAVAIECFTFPQAAEIAQDINVFISDAGADPLKTDNFNWIFTSLGMAFTVLPCAILGAFLLHRHFRTCPS
jgi:hypothetical protein